MSDVVWKSFKVRPQEGDWEPASYNVKGPDGREYGRWRRVLRRHSHGLTVISRYTAPPGKAWKIVGKASKLGEEVFIMEGAYYNTAGKIVAGPGRRYSRSVPQQAASLADHDIHSGRQRARLDPGLRLQPHFDALTLAGL